jgi:hypothetical protein
VVAVYDGTGSHLAAYVNKQKARLLAKLLDVGTDVRAISVRGTAAGLPGDQIAILAAAPVVIDRLLAPRPDTLPMPADRR